MNKIKTQAIVPTAGLGSRLKAGLPKPLVLINGKPIFIYCLEALEKSELVESVIVVASEEHIAEFEKNIKKYRLSKVSKIVVGGKERADSVYNGINVLDKDTQIVLIHDGARPLVSKELIDESVKLCYKHEAVVTAVPIKPTLKRIDQKDLEVKETLNRDQIWEIQTPQTFKKDVLIKAHKEGRGTNPTDDAALVERLGVKVKVLRGDYKNIKVTTKEDLVVAEAFLKLQENRKE